MERYFKLSLSENVGNIEDYPAYVRVGCPFLCQAGGYLFHTGLWVGGLCGFIGKELCRML